MKLQNNCDNYIYIPMMGDAPEGNSSLSQEDDPHARIRSLEEKLSTLNAQIMRSHGEKKSAEEAWQKTQQKLKDVVTRFKDLQRQNKARGEALRAANSRIDELEAMQKASLTGEEDSETNELRTQLAGSKSKSAGIRGLGEFSCDNAHHAGDGHSRPS